jgi:hypothetical protein
MGWYCTRQDALAHYAGWHEHARVLRRAGCVPGSGLPVWPAAAAWRATATQLGQLSDVSQ